MARKTIDEHTLGVLELGEVRKMLASFAGSDLGRDAAMSLYPSLDAGWITARMAETTELKTLLERDIRLPLAGLRDIRALLEDVGKKRTVFEPGELMEIGDTLAASGRLKQFLNELNPATFGHLREMGANLSDFTAVVDEINRCIEADKTVGDHASDKLRQIRRQIAQLQAQIKKKCAAIISNPQVRKALETDSFVMRHGRPVVAVKTNYRHCLHGTVLDRSNTGATLYIEPDVLVEISNELEDALFEEKKEVGRILWELTRAVLQEKRRIHTSLQAMGLIDLTYAKSRFSMAYNMAAPQIAPNESLKLRQARHPLLLQRAVAQTDGREQSQTDKVVPIDVRLGDDFDLLLVTGPNAGGKTVMLKTAGLLALMAQSGMHIPAGADSQLPIYRQIYADIGDEQSIQQNLSTFSAHIQQIVRILTNADRHSLILLDEMGAGTDPDEGAALASAILDGLLTRGGHIIATTHLGQLKTYAYSTPRAQNASVQFDSDTLMPTYQLLIGTPGSSNALAIATKFGMPDVVVKKAKSVLEDRADSASELIRHVHTTRQAAEQNRLETQAALDEARHLQQQAQQELAAAQQRGKALKDQADEEIESVMRQVRKVVNDFAAASAGGQDSTRPSSDRAKELAETLAAIAASTPLAVRHAGFMDSLKTGDTVHVIPFNRDAVVHRIARKRRTVSVFIESKQVEVGFDDVCKPTGGYAR